MKQNSFRKGVKTLKGRGMYHKAAVNKMKYYAAKNNNQLVKLSPKAAFYLILVIILALLGANKESEIATKLFAGAVAGMIVSEAAGSLVEKFGGRELKKISYTFEIWKFQFSFSAFAVAAALVEIWLFS